jgi:hypothetical protein
MGNISIRMRLHNMKSNPRAVSCSLKRKDLMSIERLTTQ